MNENKKKFRLMDAILAVICVVFVAEAAAGGGDREFPVFLVDFL